MQHDASGLADDLLAFYTAQAHYLRSLVEEETFYKQRARAKWLKDGDSNSKIFHASLAEKKQRLSISLIRGPTGEWLD